MTYDSPPSRHPTRPVVAGPLRAEFNVDTGALEYVCFGRHCIWRQLAVLVRDDQWRTVPGEVRIESLELGDNDFSIGITSYHVAGETPLFSWTGNLRGNTSGEITYSFSGHAVTGFSANRIGFCLLHPSWLCSGHALRQSRTDGSIVEGRFPELIEPQLVGNYTIRDLVKLAHRTAEGPWAEAEFQGDVFETEDQRNWSDASFKTYCTPLDLPFPVRLNAGDTRAQKVILRLLDDSALQAAKRPTHVGDASIAPKYHISIPDLECAQSSSNPAPKIGLMVADREAELSEAGQAALARAGLDVLRVDLPIAGSSWTRRLDNALKQARMANALLEIVLQLPHTTRIDLSTVTDILSAVRDDIKRVLVYRKQRPCTTREDVEWLKSRLPSTIPIGGGSDANFCELNREYALGNLSVPNLDFVSWSLTPQVHATDDRSLSETVQSLSSMVATAAGMCTGKPLVISPITLKPRFNAVGSCSELDEEVARAPADVRQHQPIVAAWMAATWLVLGGSGVHSTTWFETHGSRGLFLDSTGNAASPMISALRVMANTVSISTPLVAVRPDLVAAIIDYETQQRLLAVNLSPEPLTAWVRTDGADRSGECQQAKIDIEPYGISLEFIPT